MRATYAVTNRACLKVTAQQYATCSPLDITTALSKPKGEVMTMAVYALSKI